MTTRAFFVLAVLLLVAAAPLRQAGAPAQQPATTAARAEDVASLDAILAAIYDTISGPAGAPRDWDRFRSLFWPGARLVPVGPRPEGGAAARLLEVEDYIRLTTPFFAQQGFYEREAARRVEQFGHIAHAFSTYESRHAPADPEPFQRGINSVQLVHDDSRWWVLNICWDAERPGNPIPAKYLR